MSREFYVENESPYSATMMDAASARTLPLEPETAALAPPGSRELLLSTHLGVYECHRPWYAQGALLTGEGAAYVPRASVAALGSAAGAALLGVALAPLAAHRLAAQLHEPVAPYSRGLGWAVARLALGEPARRALDARLSAYSRSELLGYLGGTLASFALHSHCVRAAAGRPWLPSALYAGLPAALMHAALSRSVYYVSYGSALWLARWSPVRLPRRPLSLLCSSLGLLVSYPLHVIRVNQAVRPERSALEMAAEIYERQGVRGFFAGLPHFAAHEVLRGLLLLSMERFIAQPLLQLSVSPEHAEL